MVNHFATLLSNLDLGVVGPSEQAIVLGGADLGAAGPAGELDFILSDETGTRISLGSMFSSYGSQPVKNYSPLVYRHHTAIPLPTQLAKFQDILFPDSASFFYKQYLLYCYLRIIQSTDWADQVTVYDNRITYDLDDIPSYFRYFRKSAPVCNNPKYRMLLVGNIKTEEDVNSYQNNFVIRQASNPQHLRIYSLTQKKYYKQGKQGSINPVGMDVPVELAANSTTTSKIIPIGDTGLSFYITGELGEAPNFFAEDNNVWVFSAEAPLLFDYAQKINELTVISSVVEDMLEYHRDNCNVAYENIWKMHYNSVYRLAGLLLAYVERVNILWQKRQT